MKAERQSMAKSTRRRAQGAKRHPGLPSTVYGLLSDERGLSAILEFLLVVPLFMLLLALALLVTKVRPAQVTVAAAARSCARQAVTTLDQAQGLSQAGQAGLAVLQARHLNPALATVRVTPLGAWGRAAEVECRVTYTVPLHQVPLLALFSPRSEIPLVAAYRLRVDPYKSRWQ